MFKFPSGSIETPLELKKSKVLERLLDFWIDDIPNDLWVYEFIYSPDVDSERKRFFCNYKVQEHFSLDTPEIKDKRGFIVLYDRIVSTTRHEFLNTLDFRATQESERHDLSVSFNEVHYVDFSQELTEPKVTLLEGILLRSLFQNDSYRKDWKKMEANVGEEKICISYSPKMLYSTFYDCRRIHDYYLERQIYSCVRMSLSKEKVEKRFKVSVYPCTWILSKYPNGLKMMENLQFVGLLPNEINYRFKNFSVESYAYSRRGLNNMDRPTRIRSIRFDRNPFDDTVDGSGESYVDSVFLRHRINRRITRENISRTQPMLEVFNENNPGESRYVIPQLVNLNTGANLETHMQKYIDEKLEEVEGEKYLVQKVWDWVELMRSYGIKERLEEFGIKAFSMKVRCEKEKDAGERVNYLCQRRCFPFSIRFGRTLDNTFTKTVLIPRFFFM